MKEDSEENREMKELQDRQETANKMAIASSSLSVITLKANELYPWIKKHRELNGLKKNETKPKQKQQNKKI